MVMEGYYSLMFLFLSKLLYFATFITLDRGRVFPQKSEYFFLFLHKNICYGHPLKAPY